MSEKPKVIFDCDTGNDDAVALMAAVLCGRFDLIAVTTTYGNLSVENTTENTLRVLEFLHAAEIPVYMGCHEAMVKKLLPSRSINPVAKPCTRAVAGRQVSLHEPELKLPKAQVRPQKRKAPIYLLETLRHTQVKLTLILTGPATNLAMALRMDPAIAENIEEIVVMGGGVYLANETMAAEFNFFQDPEAAKMVLDCGAKVTVIPLDATHSAPFGRADVERIRAVGTPAAEFAAKLTEHCIEAEALLGFSVDGCAPMHDPLTVCYLMDRSVITDLRHAPVDVDIGGGRADGQLLMDTLSLIHI